MLAIGPTVTISTSVAAPIAQHVDPVVGAAHRVVVGADARPWGTAPPSARRRRRPPRASSSAQPHGVPRRGDADAGHDLEDREIPHAVVARPVGTGHAGAVEHERHARPVERDIHQHLVERAIDERRVDRDDRMQAAEREPGREVTACCSAMPTSKTRSGNRSAKRCSPVGRSIAAVMPTMPLVAARPAARSRRRTPRSTTARPPARATRRSPGRSGRRRGTGRRRRRQGRLVAAALLGDRVHDHGRAVLLRLLQAPRSAPRCRGRRSGRCT